MAKTGSVLHDNSYCMMYSSHYVIFIQLLPEFDCCTIMPKRQGRTAEFRLVVAVSRSL